MNYVPNCRIRHKLLTNYAPGYYGITLMEGDVECVTYSENVLIEPGGTPTPSYYGMGYGNITNVNQETTCSAGFSVPAPYMNTNNPTGIPDVGDTIYVGMAGPTYVPLADSYLGSAGWFLYRTSDVTPNKWLRMSGGSIVLAKGTC